MSKLPSETDPSIPQATTTPRNDTTSARVQAGVSETSNPHARTCVLCRQRKVKCDKKQPCSACDRAGVECNIPPGPGRAPKRPRRHLDAKLLERLSRLESIIQRVEHQTSSNNLASDKSPVSVVREQDKTPKKNSSNLDFNPFLDHELGRLSIDETRSSYTSNLLFAGIGNEIEELRGLLLESNSEDEDEQSFLGQANPDAAIMGYRAIAGSLRAHHPSLTQHVALFDVFKENVNPIVRIFHMPTLIEMYWNAIASLDSIDRDLEALMFSIYYAAVVTLDTEQCQTILGIPRPAALGRYQFAVEQAMARANLLNTQSMVLIQAAVLYLSALRNQDDSRTVWSLTALIYHIAQAMGLHRDGAAFGLRPFETELRRRLWWHICLLDVRSCENHGCEPIVNDSNYDTKSPLNINDSDLSPGMTEPPSEREGATEMTFCLIRCNAMGLVRETNYVAANTKMPGRLGNAVSTEDRDTLINDLEQDLEARYLRHCDTNSNVPILLASAIVGQLIIARTKIAVHHSFRQKDPAERLHSDLRDQLFLTSIKVLELSNVLFTNESLQRWNWYFITHMQWHMFAFVLSEICLRPPSPDCDRAWKYATLVYDRWQIKENQKKSNLWRPIKRLMAKARSIRELQRTGSETGDNLGSSQSLDNTPEIDLVDSSSGHALVLDEYSINMLDPFGMQIHAEQTRGEDMPYMADLFGHDQGMDIGYDDLFDL